jgi:hypothetical protein
VFGSPDSPRLRAPDAHPGRRSSSSSSTHPAGPSLNDRLRDALRRCRPTLRVVGVQLSQVVLDASKPHRPLVTGTFARALDQLCAMPGVPLERLEALADALRAHVRMRRGVTPPSLDEAMIAEEAAGTTANVAQWCVRGVRTLQDLCTLREAMATQLRTTQDVLDAIDREVAHRYAPCPRVIARA